MTRPNLYLAAPLFSAAEREFNIRLEEVLADTFSVFLPQRDNHLFVDLIASGIAPERARQRIFDGDVAAIRSCDLFFMVLDGRTVDEGACFELGLAYGLGKRCVGLQTDARRLLPFGNNPMLQCSLEHILGSIAEVRNWITTEDATKCGLPHS
jgi:nucleoside 2-deoxyribosyltransferase